MAFYVHYDMITMYIFSEYKSHFHNAVLSLGESVFNDDCHDIFRESLRDADPHSIVALSGRTVIGFALLSVGRCRRSLPAGIEVAFLGVHNEYQGQGIGSALLQKVKELNYEHIWLEVSTENDGARALYERHGFVVWAGRGWGDWKGYVMGYSTQRHGWLPRLRSHGHPRADEIVAPYSAHPQTDSTPAYRSRLRSARNLQPIAS